MAVTIPSQKTMVLDIRQTKKGHNNFLVPDLAMAPQDIVVKDKTVEVTVHNIGCKDSGPFEIELYDGGSKSGRLMGKQSVSNLKAPNDLEAKTITVSFQRDAKTSESGTVTAVADSEDRIYELTEVNNSLSVELMYVGHGVRRRFLRSPPSPNTRRLSLGRNGRSRESVSRLNR